MKIVGTLLCVSLLLTVLVEGFRFTRRTACRQRAWLRGTEEITSAHVNSKGKGSDSATYACGSLTLPLRGVL